MKKILIIDDDKILCKYLQRLLTDSDFKVLLAHNGDTGYQSVIKEMPDLLLLDFLLPDTDGLKLVQTIKEKNEFISTPIILMSAIYKDAAFVRQVKQVVDGFIEKPFDDSELLSLIKGFFSSASSNKTADRKKSKPGSDKEIQANDKKLEITYTTAVANNFTDIPGLISQTKVEKKPSAQAKKSIEEKLADLFKLKK